MYRTILSIALMAMLSLTGCGGSGKGSGDKNEGGKSAGASAPSTLPADQQSEVGMEIDIAHFLKDEAAAAMLDSNPDIPPFVKKMGSMSLYVALPANMGLAADPANFDFYANVSFSDAEACKAAFDELFMNAPATDVEKNGKTYKKIEAPSAPVVYVLLDGSSVHAYSEKYVDSGATSFASEGLRTALAAAPKNEPFKMAVDIAGANDFLSALGAMAPQAEAFVASKSMVMAGGGAGDLLFMMAVEAPDEDTAKKVKSTVQAGVGMLALGAASQMPDAEKAPATTEFINYLMKNLKPEIEGNSVKVVINKPENYEDMKKKMAEEAKTLQKEMMQFGGPGGPGGPGGGFKKD